MKKLKLLSILFVLFTVSTLFSQTTLCPCCTEDHQGFDFWVGDWNVYDTTGTLIGQNLILKLEDNCIVQENWKSTGVHTGSSYNYFNLQDSTWNQVWISNAGTQLILKGHASENQMVMESELLPGQKIDFYKNQIIWTKDKDGAVTQTWNILDKNGKLLQTAFKGIYKKKTGEH